VSDLEPDWVTRFRAAIVELDAAISDLRASEPSLEEACAALVALNRAKADFAYTYDDLASLVSVVMDLHPEIVLPDGSRVEKKWSSDRRAWQHRDLAAVVARRLMDSSVDMDTGEVLYSTEEILAKMLDFLQPSYWRIKELQKIGVNPDLYCEVGETKSSLIVRKAKP
jgi:hypothetical protein